MKTGIRRAFAAVLLASACSAGAGDNESYDGVGFMQGSWTGSISIRNCVSGDVLAGPFKGITTFHQGGTLSETREASLTAPRGPGHGIWYRSGQRQFKVKLVFQRFDVNGFLAGTQEIRSTNTVSRDSKTAVVSATFKVVDNNGVTLTTGYASGESQRMQF